MPCTQALQQELAYATYLNVHTAILPPPRNREHVASYARAVNAVLSTVPYMQLSVRVPIYDPSMIHPDHSAPKSPLSAAPSSTKLVDDHPSIATWEMWDTIRTICGYNPRLTLSECACSGPPLPLSFGVCARGRKCDCG